MRQSVNLYQEQFREIKVPLSAVQMLVLLGVLLVVMITVSVWNQIRLQQAYAQQQQQQQLKQQSEQQLQALSAEIKQLMENNPLDEEIAHVAKRIRMQQKIQTFLKDESLVGGQGFAEILTEVALIEEADLWLESIAITSGQLKLLGSALTDSKVPDYFLRFQQSDLFSGMNFDVFEINRSPQRNWKVDFTIASKRSDQ